jgi:hypothetical protein
MTFAPTSERYIQLVLDVMPRSMPTRTEIAIELRGHIAERLGGGQKLEDVLRQLGDPVALAESYLAAVPLVSAPFWRRAAAKVLDVFPVGIAIAPPVWLLLRSEGLTAVVERVARARGVQLVFNRSESGLHWGDPALDISDELVTQLNRATSAP